MESEHALAPYAEMVIEEWTAQSTVTAWQRWHKKTATHLRPMNQALLDAAKVKPGNRVLDLASGSGEPAITIAAIVGSEGRVYGTDISVGMLNLAKDNSEGIDNIEYHQVDVHKIPFEENSFDIVTSRLGIMYFWDCQKALQEALRVLKPGGLAAFVAWGPIENNGLALTAMSPFMKRKILPELPSGTPHPFRFSRAGSLSTELANAGLESVQEFHKVIPCPWPGPPEELWQQVYEMAVPLQPFFNSFGDEERIVAIQEAIEGYSRVYDGMHTDPTTSIVIATGTKPPLS